MPSVSVDLGSLKVAGKRPNLALTLSSSCSLNLPPSWSASPSAENLSHASSSGTLWISKAGSCQIEVSTLVNDEVPDAVSFYPSIMAAVADFVSECPVSSPYPAGNELGLTLSPATGLETLRPPSPNELCSSYPRRSKPSADFILPPSP